jgi:hypothetical protein
MISWVFILKGALVGLIALGSVVVDRAYIRKNVRKEISAQIEKRIRNLKRNMNNKDQVKLEKLDDGNDLEDIGSALIHIGDVKNYKECVVEDED